MDLVRVKSTKTYEAVYQQLRDRILSGALTPGTKLPSVRELGEQLGVGQPAVREALTALKAVNLVTMRQGEGTFINEFDAAQLARSLSLTPMNQSDVKSLLELRKILESGTASLAAVRRTKSDLKALQAAVDRMMRDSLLGEQADWEFHYGLARASKNPFVISLMDTIADHIQAALFASRQELFRIPGEPERLLNQHRAIMKAVTDRDAERAADLMLAHLNHVESLLEIPPSHQT